MCQLCDEANAYLAQLEAASKKPAVDQRKPAASSDKDAPVQEGTLGLKTVASNAPVQ